MTDLLLRLFVKHASDTSDPAVRAGYGRLAGVTGIVCNLLLFALKLLAGTISGSVSITADAVNNLSDASGSIVTLVGFKLASRPADDEHPYGHARMEYLSGLAVAVLILVIGVELVKSSVGQRSCIRGRGVFGADRSSFWSVPFCQALDGRSSTGSSAGGSAPPPSPRPPPTAAMT